MIGARGLSLLELVIAMALFALVAVMGLQTLNGTIRTRDALTARDSRDHDLSVMIALLRMDLDRVAPLLFYPPDSRPQSALHVGTEGVIGLSISAPALSDASPPFQRAEWRFDRAAGRLSRSVWPVTTPARAGQRSPERVLFTGVRSMRLRSYWSGTGWVDGVGGDLAQRTDPAPGGADSDRAFSRVQSAYSDTLPMAVEITLTLDALGEIRLLETLQ